MLNQSIQMFEQSWPCILLFCMPHSPDIVLLVLLQIQERRLDRGEDEGKKRKEGRRDEYCFCACNRTHYRERDIRAFGITVCLLYEIYVENQNNYK